MLHRDLTSPIRRAAIPRHDGWNGWKFQRPAPRKLLALERDVGTLREIAELAGRYYRVLAAHEPAHAVSLIEAEPDVAVVVAARPDEPGTMAALELLRIKRPLVRRVVLVGPLDPERFLAAIRPAAYMIPP